MKGNTWYQVNLYPRTKTGRMTVVVIENKGYDLRCKKHRGRVANCCSDWRQPRVLDTRYGVPMADGVGLEWVILRALGLLGPDRVEWDEEQNAYIVHIPRA